MSKSRPTPLQTYSDWALTIHASGAKSWNPSAWGARSDRAEWDKFDPQAVMSDALKPLDARIVQAAHRHARAFAKAEITAISDMRHWLKIASWGDWFALMRSIDGALKERETRFSCKSKNPETFGAART